MQVHRKEGAPNVVVDTTCPRCQRESQVVVPAEGFDRWRNGALIQEALPTVNMELREMLQTGICPQCWDEIFPPED